MALIKMALMRKSVMKKNRKNNGCDKGSRGYFDGDGKESNGNSFTEDGFNESSFGENSIDERSSDEPGFEEKEYDKKLLKEDGIEERS